MLSRGLGLEEELLRKISNLSLPILVYKPSSFTGFYNLLAGFCLLILEVSRSHTMTPHSR